MSRVTDFPDGIQIQPGDLFVVQRQGRFMRIDSATLLAMINDGGVTPPTPVAAQLDFTDSNNSGYAVLLS